MSYQVKEIYYTLQGEGAQTGRAAVFLRFAGCNLWSGREEDRDSATCRFCDTDFVGIDGPGGGKFATAEALARAVAAQWPKDAHAKPYVVCTGGEPLLQLDAELIRTLHEGGFEVGVESNGTLAAPDFSLSPSPASQTVLQGSATSYGFTISPTSGFASQVNLSVSGLPTGAVGSFSPNPATSTSTLSVTTNGWLFLFFVFFGFSEPSCPPR